MTPLAIAGVTGLLLGLNLGFLAGTLRRAYRVARFAQPKEPDHV